MIDTLPADERRYLDLLSDRLRQVLGESLVGLYPTGSVALDAYTPGRSDLDLIAVVEAAGPDALAAVVAALDHAALPCPAAGLEFVLYARAGLDAAGATGAGFALDLNTGRELAPKVAYSPGGGDTFWYPIDRAVCRQQDLALIGPSPRTVLPPVPFGELLPVAVASVEAHRDALTAHGDNAVLNGCRALRFGVERRWYPKTAAASWAVPLLPGFATLIRSALDTHRRGRAAGRTVSGPAAAWFLDEVLARLATVPATRAR